LTGEHVHNRVIFKQMLQAGSLDVLQLDATRVGGVNENLAIMLLAAKFGVPICPHAGGVGLCELVQHLAMFDYVRLSRELQMIEYADHLHEHFVSPARIVGGRYQAPVDPGFSAELTGRTLADYRYPDGKIWAAGGIGGSINGREPR
jgi:L-fuconate dehydratase